MNAGLALPPSLGGYRIVGRLSEGGMGAVVLGRREGAQGFEKQVAIKVLLPQYLDSPEVQELFFSEARLAARLSHPAVCQVFDFGQDQGLYYLVMEYLVGDSVTALLGEQLRRGEHMPLELAARIVAEAARGLHHAHTLGDERGQPLHVVHRDVSPQNLMLTVDGAVKVLDFGIAKSRDRATATQQGILRGKPAYMSPEQARGEGLDARSDLFSLGTVLCELWTHHNPFVRDGVYATIQAIASVRAPDSRALRPDLPEAAARILNCALAPDREERFASADVMARALDQLIAHLGRPSGAAELAAHLRLLFPQARREPALPSTATGRASNQQTQPAGSPAEGRPTAVSDADLRPARWAARVADRDATADAIAASTTTGRRRWLLGTAALLVVGAGLVIGLRLDDTTRGVGASFSVLAVADASAPVVADASIGLAAAPDAAIVVEDGTAVAAIGAVTRMDAGRQVTPRPRPSTKPPRPLPAKKPVVVVTPQPVPAQPTTFGKLSVLGTSPYFLVYVDNEPLGATPIQGHRLATGTHKLVLKDPASNRTVLARDVVILEGIDTRVSEHLGR